MEHKQRICCIICGARCDSAFFHYHDFEYIYLATPAGEEWALSCGVKLSAVCTCRASLKDSDPEEGLFCEPQANSDLEAAVAYGMQLGCDQFVFYLDDTRTDELLAALQIMQIFEEQNVHCTANQNRQNFILLSRNSDKNGSLTYIGSIYEDFSLFALSARVEGLTIGGTDADQENTVLYRQTPLLHICPTPREPDPMLEKDCEFDDVRFKLKSGKLLIVSTLNADVL